MDYVTFYIITFASLCASCTIIANVPCVTSNLALISKQTTPQWTHIFSPFITKARFLANAICILINNPFQMDLTMVPLIVCKINKIHCLGITRWHHNIKCTTNLGIPSWWLWNHIWRYPFWANLKMNYMFSISGKTQARPRSKCM